MSFEEKSGIIDYRDDRLRWWQNIEEVCIEIDLGDEQKPHSARDVKCSISNRSIDCSFKGREIIKGQLYSTIQSDDSTWTLEDKRIIRIVLSKANPDAANCWMSLLSNGEFAPTPFQIDEMQKKLTLERYQRENPGMDFSGADISGNYQSGGPRLPI